VINEKPIADFTRGVEQMGILKRQRRPGTKRNRRNRTASPTPRAFPRDQIATKCAMPGVENRLDFS